MAKETKEEKMKRIAAADEAMNKEVEKEADAQAQLENTAKANNGDEEAKAKVVEDVIAGKYGTGVERRTNLQNAGFDPDEIQKAVNTKVATEKKPEPVNDTAIEQQANEDLQKEVQEVNTDVNPEDAESMQIGNDTEVTPEMEEQLNQTEEGQEAQAAVQNNDPTALQNIVTPEGDAVLKGGFDVNGNYIPHVYTDKEVGGMSKGMAGALTIISVALAGLGAAFGIPLVPVNFYKLFGKPEMVEAMNKQEQNYADIINNPKMAGNTARETSLGSATGRQEAYENQANAANANPDIYNTDTQNQVAGAQAAVSGQNTALDVQKANQEFEAKMKQMDQDFAKEMNNINTESQIAVLKQQAVNQQDLARLMNDLDAQRIMKKIAYAKNAGLTPDETAKWLRAEQGITQFGAAMGYVGDVADVAGKVAGAMMGGNSDKGCKKFDWGKSNTNMLRKGFKWR